MFARRAISGHRTMPGFVSLRANLARVVLLSLELLVAADIVQTVAVDLTFARLGNLALIALIRTFLSFAIEVDRRPLAVAMRLRGRESVAAPGRGLRAATVTSTTVTCTAATDALTATTWARAFPAAAGASFLDSRRPCAASDGPNVRQVTPARPEVRWDSRLQRIASQPRRRVV